MSGLVNKVKDALSSDKSSSHTHSSTTTHQHGTTGTHPSENQRVGQEGTTFTQPQGQSFAATGNEPNRGLSGPASSTDGPHNSNLMNKADPRVDSDGDRSRNLGMNPQGTATTGTTTTGTTHGMSTRSAGMTGENVGTHSGGVPEGTYGHHNSRLANAADPRIDSDLDSRRTAGTTGATTGGFTEGTHTSHHTTGQHAGHQHAGHGTENLSSTTGTQHRTGMTGTGDHLGHNHPGPAPNTAGPHKSDMLNKADPRVDSDLDGSKTVGGDKTFSQGGVAGRGDTL